LSNGSRVWNIGYWSPGVLRIGIICGSAGREVGEGRRSELLYIQQEQTGMGVLNWILKKRRKMRNAVGT